MYWAMAFSSAFENCLAMPAMMGLLRPQVALVLSR